MAVKKIYIVRHGQTKFNQQGIVQGRGVDASLDETGISQADQFFNSYKDLPFQKILISTLKRTYESVEKFIRKGIPYERYEGLDEISWGIHEGVKASELRNEYFRNIVDSWHSGDTSKKIEGGESPEDVAHRQLPVIDRIKKMPEDMILICMHGRALRVLMCLLLDLPLSEMDHFGHHNLGLYIVEFDGSNFRAPVRNSIEHFKSLS